MRPRRSRDILLRPFCFLMMIGGNDASRARARDYSIACDVRNSLASIEKSARARGNRSRPRSLAFAAFLSLISNKYKIKLYLYDLYATNDPVSRAHARRLYYN